MVKDNRRTYSIDSCFLIKHLGNPNLFSSDYCATILPESSCLVRCALKSFSNTTLATILAFNKQKNVVTNTNICKWLQVDCLRGLSWVWRKR